MRGRHGKDKGFLTGTVKSGDPGLIQGVYEHRKSDVRFGSGLD